MDAKMNQALCIGGAADGQMVNVYDYRFSVGVVASPMVSLIRKVLKKTRSDIHHYHLESFKIDSGEPIEFFILDELSTREAIESLILNYRPDIVTRIEELEEKLKQSSLTIAKLLMEKSQGRGA